MKTLAASLLILCSVSFSAIAETPTDAAKKFFATYQELANNFDRKFADLFADEAKIENKRTYPDGKTRVTSFEGKMYKPLIRSMMPLAKARGDKNTFSDIKYTAEAGRVRITATRFNQLKDYSSPISVLVGPSTTGEWLVYEELTESKP